VSQSEDCCCGPVVMKPGTVREPRGRRMFAVGSRSRVTASEDVTEDTSVCVIVNCKA
jgi:hypothetical protein